MGEKLSPVIDALKAWREARALSQREAVRVLAAAGLPVKLSTLQKWEIGRSIPNPVTAASLDRFLTEQQRTAPPRRAPAPVILRLRQWREQNNLTQAQAVQRLVAAGLPIKLSTLQQWEMGRHYPPPITETALTSFLDRTLVLAEQRRLHARAKELRDQLAVATDSASRKKLEKDVFQLVEDLFKITSPKQALGDERQQNQHKR